MYVSIHHEESGIYIPDTSLRCISYIICMYLYIMKSEVPDTSLRSISYIICMYLYITKSQVYIYT